MIAAWLIERYWIVAALWAAVYSSDYALTISAARLFQGPLREHLALEGSYEATPLFEGDIDRLAWLSPRFVAMLAFSATLLLIAGWSAARTGIPEIFTVPAGAMFLLEAAVYVRHLRNHATARFGVRPGALAGQLVRSRRFSFEVSAAELASFAALYLVVAAVEGSWAWAGGAALCARTALSHGWLARRATPT